MRFYTTEQLSKNLSRTPEGFLLARDVPIARTGEQLYHYSELPPIPGGEAWTSDPRGVVRISRDPEEVFRAETVASCSGKSVINEHPSDGEGAVNPENWRALSMGVVLDPRRGKGIFDDLLIADLLITDKDAIEAVLSGKRELSCGYDCDYVRTGDGLGLQKNIVVNHVALVEKGRCGARCAIGDNAAQPKGAFMKVIDRLREMVSPGQHAQLENVLKLLPADAAAALTRDCSGTGDSALHLHLGGNEPETNDKRKYSDAALDEQFNKIEKRFEESGKVGDERHKAVMDAIGKLTPAETATAGKDEEANRKIEGEIQAEAPPGTGDAAMKAKDSVLLIGGFNETLALAEILAPGIALPTFDSAADPKVTLLAITNLRKKALSLGNNDPATNAIITQVRGGREWPTTTDELGKLAIADIRTQFMAAGAMKKQANAAAAAAATRDLGTGGGNRGGGAGDAPKVTSIADVNKRNRDFYTKTA